VELGATYGLAILFDGMERAWTYSVADALEYFKVQRTKGLSDKQVVDAQARYGSNGSYVTESLIYRVERGRISSAVALSIAAVSRSACCYPSRICYGIFNFGPRGK